MPWLGYGARFYDAAIGRWWVRDPKAEKAQAWTPYSYVGGNVVRLVDPNGKETSIHVDPYGNIIAKYDDGDNGVYMHSKGVTNSDIDEQRETLHNTGGFRHYIGELGGVVDADVIFENVLEKDMREAKSMVNPIKS